jgi:UPF0755 protein
LKKVTLFFSLSALLFLLVLFFIFLDLLHYAEKHAGPNPVEKLVAVCEGESFKALTYKLREAGIIRHPHKFQLLGRIKGYDKKIKAGEYRLSAAMPPAKILEKMVNGDVHLYRLTIPEGYNLRQIASVVAEVGLGTRNGFLTAATDTARAHEKGIDADTFEGYLFPDTYYFPKTITCPQIISAMVRRFRHFFTDDWKKQAEKLGLSIHQVITLASIIEKETGAGDERPIIASVFHNRLKKGMRLESDPTVIYGIKDFDGNITRRHLVTPNPYNTYIIKGLPPGPIANPGLKALEAALFPDDTRFLYFVSKKDGSHQFSTSLKDHNRAVRKYQISR